MKSYILPALLFFSISLHAQQVVVRTRSGTDNEQRAKEQMERILKTYDKKIRKWIFTDTVEIAQFVTPHSHPVLTLNGAYRDNDELQLCNFIHEQFHWFVSAKPEQQDKAINELKTFFPEVPVGGKTGARDTFSTYLHLIVCDLEYQGMIKVVGKEKARQMLSEWTFYTWIYDKVLNDERIRKVNKKYGFIAP